MTSSVLQRELNALQTLQLTESEISCDVYDVATRMLSLQLSWQRHMKAQLHRHGIELASDDDEDVGKLLIVVLIR